MEHSYHIKGERRDWLKADLGYKPSYLWRSLLAARPLIEEGHAWRIGDGRSVSIWNDRWIGIEKYGKTSSIEKEGWSDAKVAEVIEEETGRWNKDLQHELLYHNDVEKIVRIPLSSQPTKDRRIWRFTKKWELHG